MYKLCDIIAGERRKGEALPSPKGTELPAAREKALIGTPAVDLVDKGDALVLRSEMPGLEKKNISVSVTEDNISISGKVERAKEEKEENCYYSERAYSSCIAIGLSKYPEI